MKIITSTVRALCLADLVDDEYMVVASRENYEVNWHYWLSKSERAIYQDMVAHKEIISPTRRNPDRSCDLLAMLARA